MKGVVFTEFLDMVDDTFGMEMTESIVSGSDLPSGGVYTSVGTYDHNEIVSLVGDLSRKTHIDISELVHVFGRHLMSRFVEIYPAFFEVSDVLTFLENVDGYIHGEVRKLYPDAALPNIETKRLDGQVLELIYRSHRMMGDLAEGLIEGALVQFGNTHACSREDLPDDDGCQCVKFTLKPLS